MPYIKNEQRNEIDLEINALIEKLNTFSEDSIEGVMNYTITRLVCESVPRPKGEWRYKWINRIVGTLECVKQEFYRRLAFKYEDSVILKNGDIGEYV
jgi:hypothetical protein